MNTTYSQLVVRYVSKGGNPADGARLLREIFEAHTGDNLAHALCYWGFTTETQATQIAKHK